MFNKSSKFSFVSFKILPASNPFLWTADAFASVSYTHLDYLSFCLFTFLGVQTITATYIARLISSLFNYTLNRKYVFKNDGHVGKTMVKYYILVFIVAGLSGLFTKGANMYLGINVYIAKIIVDMCLYVVSYNGQKYFVFK